MRVFAQAAPEQGVLVAVVVRLAGLWWKNISRVIYTIDEPHVFGFAYGTLPGHAAPVRQRFDRRDAEAGGNARRVTVAAAGSRSCALVTELEVDQENRPRPPAFPVVLAVSDMIRLLPV